MNVTEVRVTIHPLESRVLADVEFVYAGLAVHNVRVIRGNTGFVVAMPQRLKTSPCPRCRKRNEVLAAYCQSCGRKRTMPTEQLDRHEIWLDVVHPISQVVRDEIEAAVLAEYRRELVKQEAEACAS